MKRVNVYAKDLETYLKAVNNLNIRKTNIRNLREKISLSRKSIGVACEPSIDDTMAFLSEYDSVRAEMIERIEGSTLLSTPEIARELRRAGFASADDFLARAKEELTGEQEKGALRRVLLRGESVRVEAQKNRDPYVEFDSDMFHPMGRINESEIGQAINVQTVKQLVRSFK